MITAKIDYRNLQFILYQDNKPVENPLPAEVQRVVIEQIIRETTGKIYRQLDEKLYIDNVLRRLAAH